MTAVVSFGADISERGMDWDYTWYYLTQSLMSRVISVGALLAVAWSLFQLRERRPRTYGWIEITFGTLALYLAVSADLSSNFERAVKVATGVYLVVRGHDNRINGYKRLLERQATKKNVTAAAA